MTETNTIVNDIVDGMSDPLKVTGDSGSVEMPTVYERIAAVKFLQSREAVQNKSIGIKIQKISPDGTL